MGTHGKAAGELQEMNQRFYDDADGGFYFTDKGADDLIVRQKMGSDSPLPSGNAVAAMVMLEMNGAGDRGGDFAGVRGADGGLRGRG